MVFPVGFIDRQIDELDDGDRNLLAAASIIRREFATAAVAAALGADIEQIEAVFARLARRGMTLSGVLLAGSLGQEMVAAAVPAALAQGAVHSALHVAAGGAAPGVYSAQAVVLADGIVRAVAFAKMKAASFVALLLGAAAAGLGVLIHQPAEGRGPDPAAVCASPVPKKASWTPGTSPILRL